MGAGNTVVRGGIGKFYLYMPVSLDLNQQQTGVVTLYPDHHDQRRQRHLRLHPAPGHDHRLRRATSASPRSSQAGQAELARLREAVLAGTTYNRNPRIDDPDRQLPYQWSCSFGVSQQLGSNAAIAIDYVGNVSHDQLGHDRHQRAGERRAGPAPAVFDPDGELIPPEARGTNFQRVLQMQTRARRSTATTSRCSSSFVKRMANRWSGRVSYTLQKSHYVGLGNPDARRVWLDNDIRADYGRFASDRTPRAGRERAPSTRGDAQRLRRAQRDLRLADQRDGRAATSTATTTTTTGRSAASTT